MRKTLRRAAALAVAAASISSATASTPPLLWQGVTALGVQCIVARGPYRSDPVLGPELCERVARLAARQAPFPVQVVPLGEPAVATGRAALLVHASVETTRSGRLMAISIRPLGNAAQSTILFGAAPKAVMLPSRGLTSPALDAAVSAALAETLPWQTRPSPPQPLATEN